MGEDAPLTRESPSDSGTSFTEEALPTPKHNPDKPKRTPSTPGVDPVTASKAQLKALGLTVIDGG